MKTYHGELTRTVYGDGRVFWGLAEPAPVPGDHLVVVCKDGDENDRRLQEMSSVKGPWRLLAWASHEVRAESVADSADPNWDGRGIVVVTRCAGYRGGHSGMWAYGPVYTSSAAARRAGHRFAVECSCGIRSDPLE